MRETPKESKWVASCCLAILLTLYIVGAMNHGVLRQVVQTLPLWVPIVLGFRGSEFAKWSAPALSGYLDGNHGGYLGVWSCMGLCCIGTIFSGRPGHDAYRCGGFRGWVLRGSSLAYRGTSVLGKHCSSSVRRAAVFGTLGESGAVHPPLILLHILLGFCVVTAITCFYLVPLHAMDLVA